MFKPTHDFKIDSQDTEAPDTAPDSQESRTFQLNDFVTKTQSKKRGFSFDSEKARNFDPISVRKSQEGVLGIFADAMERIKLKAQEAKEEATQEGRDQGYREGFQEGEEKARQEFAPFLETLNATLEEMSAFRKKMYPKVEREMIEMIVDISRKILGEELAKKENAIQDIIRLAVQSVLDRETMVIRVHPDDKVHAENYRPQLQTLFHDIRNLSFEGQPAIPRGSCIVETNFGSIEAGIDHLHDHIERILHMAPPPVETASPEPPAAESSPPTTPPADSANSPEPDPTE